MADTATPGTTQSDHTYAIAERLSGIASDSLYTFTPGLQQLSIDTFPEDLRLLARFITHDWGISAQIWARDEHGVLQASAEASAGPLDEVSSIHSRIKHFRSGSLLWTASAHQSASRRSARSATASPPTRRSDGTATACTPNRASTSTRTRSADTHPWKR
jgi:hypothetical protein